jgi:hypothetical protein
MRCGKTLALAGVGLSAATPTDVNMATRPAAARMWNFGKAPPQDMPKESEVPRRVNRWRREFPQVGAVRIRVGVKWVIRPARW